MVKHLFSAEYRQQGRALREVVQADAVCASAPVRLDRAVEVVALVHEVDIFGRHVRKQERLAAVLRDVDNLVEDFVGPGTQVGREDNLLRSGECRERVAGFFAVVEEADLLHGALHVGAFHHDQVFGRGMDFLAVVLERNLDLELALVARSHERADAELRKACLAGRLFGEHFLLAQFLAACIEEAYVYGDVLEAVVVQERKLETHLALRGDHVFKFADKHAARGRDFLAEFFETLALAVLVADAAEVGAEVRPLFQEESGNLRVALEGGNLVELALCGDLAGAFDEIGNGSPHGKPGFLDEGLDGLVGILDGLLVLDTARALDVCRRVREQGVVLDGHQHLVADVGCRAVFAVLEVAVAESGIGYHQFFFVLVEAVGEVVRVGGVRVHLRANVERGELRNAVDRDGEELARILAEIAFVVDIDTVEVADCRASHVHGADGVQKLVAVLEHECAVFGTEHPGRDARMVMLFLDDIVDEVLRVVEAGGRGTHRVDGEFLEHQKANLVTDVESLGAERGAAAADGVEACSLYGQKVLLEVRVACGPEAALAPLLVVAHALQLEDGIVQVEVALDAVELAEAERAHHGECVFGRLALAGLDFHLHFDGEHVGLFGAPHALAAVEILDAENQAVGRVLLVELRIVLEPFEHVAVRVTHEDAQARAEPAGVVERDFEGHTFLVHVRFHVQVRNEGRVPENQVHVPENASERVLRPGQAYRNYARVGVTVVGAFLGFAPEVDAAVGGAHVGHADAEHVLFAELDGLLGFENKWRVGPEVVTEQLAVEPDGGMRGNALKTEENALCDLFFVFDGETLEVECAVLRHQKLFERPFPDMGDGNGFGVFGVCRIPAIGNAGILSVPFHLPVAVKAHNLVHSGVLYEIFGVKIEKICPIPLQFPEFC